MMNFQSVRFSAEPMGIGSILSENLEAKQRRSGGNSSPSLRKTLSADMSSQEWIQNNLLRKTCSSPELSSNSDFEQSDEEWDNVGEQDDGDIFSLTDGEEEEESTLAVEEDRDTWSLIRLQNQKSSLSSLIPAVASVQQNKTIESLSQWEPCKPYVHQKKKSTLSDQSLLMCTEALGCESGTDSSHQSLSYLESISSSSEDNISLQEDTEEEGSENVEFESEMRKFPCNVREKEATFGAKSIRSRSAFPPPLSSASGSAVYMRSFKQGGRLLLQAVKVDSHKSLRAHRHDGRLQLRFINSPPKCCPTEEEREEEEEKFKAPKCPESQPSEERKQEKEFKISAPEDRKSLTPQPQLKPHMFSDSPNFRCHVLKPDSHNYSLNKECFFNSNFDSKEEQQQSLLKEVRGSRRRSNNFSNEFHHKLCRDPLPLSPKLNSSNKTLCKAAVPVSLNAFKNSLQSRPPSQSLITSPSLLNHPRNEIFSAGRDLNQYTYSLPKLLLMEGFRRCKEHNLLRNWESYPIAIS